MPFDKSAFLSAPDRATEKVETPEWAAAGLPSVYVRSLTGKEREQWNLSLFGGKPEDATVTGTEYTTSLLTQCVTDEAGALLFDAADAGALAGKSAAVLERLARVAQRLNGLGKAAEDAAAKN